VQKQPDSDTFFASLLRHACACVQVVEAGLQAGKVVGAVAKVCGGGGGGKPQLAQAGAKDSSKLKEALELARSTLMQGL